MNTIILTSIFISLFIVGLRLITSPGMIFYFLREEYDSLSNQLITIKRRIISTGADIDAHHVELAKLTGAEKSPAVSSRMNNIREYIDSLESIIPVLKKQEKQLNLKVNLLKPIIGCGVCMASFWTLVFILPGVFGGTEYILDIPLIMMITAGFNGIILQLYDLMKAKANCNCK